MANNEVFGVSDWEMRPTRRLYIVNGSDLVTAKKQQAFLPTEENSTILSAEPVVRTWVDSSVDTPAKMNDGAQRFVRPSKALLAAGKPVYFANADAKDWDVKASGKLHAIFAGDDFEVQVPFFDTTQSYNPGDKLYIKKAGADGEDETAAPSILTNKSTEAMGTVVVGIVSKGVIDLGSQATQNVPAGQTIEAPNGVSNLVQGGPRAWANDTGSRYVLQFYTKFIPAQA